MKRDCLPDGLHLFFGNVVGVEKLSGGICAVDLEAFVLARERPDEAEIVKCGGHVKEFRIEAQFPLTTLPVTTLAALTSSPNFAPRFIPAPFLNCKGDFHG